MSYKHGNIPERFAGYGQSQVVAAAHQANRLDFFQLHDGAGDLLKAKVFLGCNFDFDAGEYGGGIGFIPINYRLVAADYPGFSYASIAFATSSSSFQHDSQLFVGKACVILQ